MVRFTPRFLLPTLLCSLLAAGSACAQGRPDPAVVIAAQREAMTALAKMDGVWRGSAWTILPSGEKHDITQTERIGLFLDGSVRVMEGRGYDSEGKDPVRFFEMTLKRVGDSDWPAAGAIPAK